MDNLVKLKLNNNSFDYESVIIFIKHLKEAKKLKICELENTMKRKI